MATKVAATMVPRRLAVGTQQLLPQGSRLADRHCEGGILEGSGFSLIVQRVTTNWCLRPRAAMYALLGAALVGGCDAGGDAKQATQVAARVNSDEVTVHQLNYLLVRVEEGCSGDPERVKREILEKLIDRQLAQQQAIANKLDRSPAVMQAIEAARSEILGQAYFEKIAAAQPAPTEEEVRSYYAAHPELFAERRIFQLEELVVVAESDLAQRLREQVNAGRSMQSLSAWLRSQQAKFAENRGMRPAEQIPLDILPQLQTMKEGEIRFVGGGGRLNVFRVVAIQPSPVDESTAAPRIRQLLFNQRLVRVIAEEMAEHRRRSKIEFFGEFAQAAGKSSAEAAPKPDSASTKEQTGPDLQKAVRGLR